MPNRGGREAGNLASALREVNVAFRERIDVGREAGVCYSRRMKWRSPALLILGSLAVSSCGQPVRDGLPDVVLVTIDTLRADHLGLYGYPRGTSPVIDRWFGRAALFERSFSTAASTPPSVISLLSGLAPPEHQVRLYYQLVPGDVRLVTELLPAEYQTAAFVSNVVLTDEAMGIASRFDHFDDFVDEKEPNRVVYERNGRRTTDAALEWLVTGHDPDRPTFLWVHYIDPHGPYVPPDGWPRTFASEEPRPVAKKRIPRYVRMDEEPDGNEYVDRYDDEIRYLDRHLGRLLAGLDGLLELDESLLILTSDHGESLMDHEQWFRHGHHVYDEVVHVPLLVRGPGIASGIRRGPVSGLDVLPSVLEFVGASVPSDLPGVPVQSPAPSGRVVEVEATPGNEYWRAAVGRDVKWMARIERFDVSVTEARHYDLMADPREVAPRPAPDLHPERLEEWLTDPFLTRLPEEVALGHKLERPKVSPRADSTAIERLRALGYVQ